MGFNELFEHQNEHKQYQYNIEHSYCNGFDYSNRYSEHKYKPYYWSYFLNVIWLDRKLRLLAILFTLIIVSLIILLIIALFPLVPKFTN